MGEMVTRDTAPAVMGVRLTWRRIHVVMAPIWTREPVNVPRVTLRKLAAGRGTPFTQSAWAQTETQSDPPVGAVTTPWQTGLNPKLPLSQPKNTPEVNLPTEPLPCFPNTAQIFKHFRGFNIISTSSLYG